MPPPNPETHSLLLLRGLPGSGKTTLAGVLSENNRYPVYSIDSYFINEQGDYHFEHTKNHLAYKNCESQTEAALKDGMTKIIVDNTFTHDWEMEPYFRLAETYGYRLFVLTVENRHNGKNVHGVSEQQLEKMRQKFQVKL